MLNLKLLDVNGLEISEGVMIQFDYDSLGHGLTRIIKRDAYGILGFEAVPNVSDELCYVEAWLECIRVVEKEKPVKFQYKHMNLDGSRYFF